MRVLNSSTDHMTVAKHTLMIHHCTAKYSSSHLRFLSELAMKVYVHMCLLVLNKVNTCKIVDKTKAHDINGSSYSHICCSKCH